MDAARGSGLISGYNPAVEKLRETEYPMLNGMPYEKHQHFLHLTAEIEVLTQSSFYLSRPCRHDIVS